MNLDKLDILVKSITKRGQYASPKKVSQESLFFNFGTLTEEQASELLWLKREQIERKIKLKYDKLDSSFICPVSLCFNDYTNYARIKQ